MQGNQTKLDADYRAARMAEYATLRDEILKRIDLRQQLISMTLTIAAAFLAVGIGTATVSLVYPPLAALLALSWRQNDISIRRASAYIREHHEKEIPGLSWETYSQHRRADWRSVVISHMGTFLLTQLLAVGVGLFTFQSTWPEIFLLIVDIVSMIMTVAALMYGFRGKDTPEKP